MPTVDEKPFSGRMKAIQVRCELERSTWKVWTKKLRKRSRSQNSGFAAPSAARQDEEEQEYVTSNQARHSGSLLRSYLDPHAKQLVTVCRNSGAGDTAPSWLPRRHDGGAKIG